MRFGDPDWGDSKDRPDKVDVGESVWWGFVWGMCEVSELEIPSTISTIIRTVVDGFSQFKWRMWTTIYPSLIEADDTQVTLNVSALLDLTVSHPLGQQFDLFLHLFCLLLRKVTVSLMFIFRIHWNWIVFINSAKRFSDDLHRRFRRLDLSYVAVCSNTRGLL